MEDTQQPQEESSKDKIKNFVIGFGVLCLIGWSFQYCGDNKSSTPSSSSSSNSGSSSSSEETCPHCHGKGKRYNNVTLDYGTCASCGGDGEVTSQEYERLSK